MLIFHLLISVFVRKILTLLLQKGLQKWRILITLLKKWYIFDDFDEFVTKLLKISFENKQFNQHFNNWTQRNETISFHYTFSARSLPTFIIKNKSSFYNKGFTPYKKDTEYN